MKKKSLIILLFFLLGICIIYYPNLNKKLFKNKVYIVYDFEKDTTNIIDWNKFRSLLPHDFEPDKIIDYIYVGSPLTEVSSQRVDSIIDLYHKSPRKFINKHGNKMDFGIQISSTEEYVFDYDKFIIMDNNKLDELKAMSIDSIIRLLNKRAFDEKSQFFIVVLNLKKSEEAYIAKARPTIVIQ